MGIEHFAPASSDSEGVNYYGNCFYCCRLCNQARALCPVVDANRRRLINPCTREWSQCFYLAPNDCLLAVAENPDAQYTLEAYAFNDLRKVEMRRERRESLANWKEDLSQGPELLETLLAVSHLVKTREEKERLGTLVDKLRADIQRALTGIQGRAAIPRDADTECRCGRTDHHILPAWLDSQTWDVPS